MLRKAKKYLVAIAVALCCLVPGVSVGAAQDRPATQEQLAAPDHQVAPTQPAAPNHPTVPGRPASPAHPSASEQPKELQKQPASVEMEWQRLNDTWQNLSKRQREQLYKAREAVDKADCNFIDKAVEFKLIDKEIGERMKEHIKARTARIRQDGDLPMFRRGIKQKIKQG